MLLRNRADVDLAAKDGGTAMVGVAVSGDLEIVQLLLQARADLEKSLNLVLLFRMFFIQVAKMRISNTKS